MTNAEKILQALEKAGKKGIHSFDLAKIGGWRYAARIHELRKEGNQIAAIHERQGKSVGVRYKLEPRSM